MFEPPEGIEDFTNDATAFADTRTTVVEPAKATNEEAEIARLMAEVEQRKAALARRSDAPQVIDPTGNTIAPGDDDQAPEWPHHVIEIQGKQIQVRKPSPAAIRFLAVFGFGDKGVARGDFSNFMNRHVSEKSVAEIKDWTYSGEIDENFYDELQKKLFTMGTARPTGPSPSSPRSR